MEAGEDKGIGISGVSLTEMVAGISTWANNCALSCTSVFLVNAFLANKLSKKAEIVLASLFNSYYRTSLSIQQLRLVFRDVFALPSERQVVLGPMLRNFIYEQGVRPEAGDMLSNEAFTPLARAFDFNVNFYVGFKDDPKNRDKITKVIKSGTIPDITINPEYPLTIRPLYVMSHYDLIMDDKELAESHNASSFILSQYDLPIEAKEAKDGTGPHVNELSLKQRVKEIISARYKGYVEQVGEIIKNIGNLYETHSLTDDVAEKIILHVTIMKDAVEEYLKKGSKLSINDFIRKTRSAILGFGIDLKEPGMLGWIGGFFVNDGGESRIAGGLREVLAILTLAESEYARAEELARAGIESKAAAIPIMVGAADAYPSPRSGGPG